MVKNWRSARSAERVCFLASTIFSVQAHDRSEERCASSAVGGSCSVY